MLISHLPDNDRDQTEFRSAPTHFPRYEYRIGNTSYSGLAAYGRSLVNDVPRSKQSFGRGPVQTHVKGRFEVPGVGVCRSLGGDGLAADHLDRRRPALSMPAGHDAVEIAEIRGQVQGEPMAHDRSIEFDTDRCQLLALAPDSCESRLARH